VPKAKEALLKFSDGTRLNIHLKEDSISVIPLDRGLKVEVRLTFEKGKAFYNVSGGAFGLVIDNRSRPLLESRGSKERITLIEKWLKEINSKIDFDLEGDSKDKKKEEKGEVKEDIPAEPLKKEMPKEVPKAGVEPLKEEDKKQEELPKEKERKRKLLPAIKPKLLPKMPKKSFLRFPKPSRPFSKNKDKEADNAEKPKVDNN